VVFDESLGLEERAEVVSKIWERLEERGVPPYYRLSLEGHSVNFRVVWDHL